MQLPRASNTKAALAQNEEFAAAMLEGDTDEDEGPQRAPVLLSEYTPEVSALYDVVDRLGDVCAGLVGLGGKKPRQTRPVPRPKTAFDRVALENRRKSHRSLVDRVLPGRAPQAALPPST
jgi:hypothetical protein